MKHEEKKGKPRDVSKDNHPGRRRPITQGTSGSLGGASGTAFNAPKK